MRKFITAMLAAGTLATASPALADGGLTFTIVGDTFFQPFQISNTSTAGETVIGFGISLIDPFGFDTETDGFGINAPRAFSPNAGSASATGYTGPSSFLDGAKGIDFTFNDFQVGEAFIWDIDVDSPTQVTVLGSDLVGSTGYADFSNGLRGLGTFQALGATGSQFVITTFTPIPAIPEPATWMMMVGGMGLIGASLRRRAFKPALA